MNRIRYSAFHIRALIVFDMERLTVLLHQSWKNVSTQTARPGKTLPGSEGDGVEGGGEGL